MHFKRAFEKGINIEEIAQKETEQKSVDFDFANERNDPFWAEKIELLQEDDNVTIGLRDWMYLKLTFPEVDLPQKKIAKGIEITREYKLES